MKGMSYEYGKGLRRPGKDVLRGVTRARAKVGSIQATPELLDNPEAFARFQAAEGSYRVRSPGCWWCPRIIRS